MPKNTNIDHCDAQVPSKDVTFLDIHSHIGLITMEFNNLELNMLLLLSTIIGTSQEIASLIWENAQWGKRIEIVDAIIRNSAAFENFVPFWAKTFSLLKEVGGDRNFIVHGSISVTYHLDGSYSQFLVQNKLMGQDTTKRDDTLDLSEIREILFDIRAAHLAVSTLQHSIITNNPSPDNLAAMSVRQRPPRHIRRGR